MENKRPTQKPNVNTAVSSQKLLVSGAHFGHQTKRWNPKMKKFIYTSKKGVHVINLSKTIQRTQVAYEFLKTVSEKGGEVIFIGTKKQAKNAIKEQAQRCGAMYVSERWLGGTLTNFKTIKNNFRRMTQIEKMEKEGTFNLLSKKEVIGIKKEYYKLNNLLSGIRKMRYMPKAIFVIDPIIELNAVKEAKKLGIPVVSIVDTNCDPDIIDFPIPGNDDANKSVELFITLMADAINEGKGIEPILAYTKDEEIKFPPRRTERSRDGKTPFKRHSSRDFDRSKSFKSRERFKPRVERTTPKTEVTASRVEATTPKVETPTSKIETTTPKTEVTTPKVETPTSKIETTTPKTEVTTPKTEVTTPKVETPASKVETTVEASASKVETTTPKTEVAASKAKVPASKVETPTPKVVETKSDSVDFNSMKLIELRDYAKTQELKGYSSLKKDELIKFIKDEENK